MNLFILPIILNVFIALENPIFEAQTIDSNVSIGYGIVVGDVDGDGKPDLILADKKQFVWYRNGDWKRFILAENLTERDNVCIAARDINGDGKVEIAVGGQWNPGETSDEAQSGSVHYLIRPSDPTELWTAVQLPHEPTVHRMYWVKTGYSDYQLVVLPLHGRGNKGGEGAGVKVIGYKKPADPKSPWKTQLIDESMHLTHNITSKDLGAGAGETIFIGGKEGIKSFSYQDGEWFSEPTEESTLEDHSFGELSLADNPSIGMLLAGVEPMHGNQVTVYLGPIGKTESTQLRRIVIDETLKEGHGIATGDFLGNGSVQTVAGWRTPNEDGDIGIKLYEPINEGYTEFKTHWIDQNGMATESLTAADLNGDGKLDIIAAGRSTNNLKVYWNRR